ncbi:HlyD family efflux transporter periplasmic adaptor subunit [Peptococcaceae bacterium 1198_IL3148]
MDTNSFTAIEKNKKRTLIILLVIIAITALIFTGYRYQNNSTQAQEQADLSITGTIEARSAIASFKVPGKLETLLVDEGAKVEAGQKLATLENSQLQAKLTQAAGAAQAAAAQAQQAREAITLTEQQVETTIAQLQAKVEQAEVGLKNAQQLYDRMTVLHNSDAISQSDYDQAVNGYQLAQSQLAEAKAALDQAIASRTKVATAQSEYQAALGQSQQAQGALHEAQAYLNDATLKAPIAGYITQKYLEVGEMLNAGTPVFEVSDLTHPYVKVYISEDKIGRVHLNQQAEVKVDAFPNQVFKGQVVWINNAGEFAVKKAVNEQQQHDVRSYEVKIDVPNPDLLLKVGMTATVNILQEAE